MRRLRLRLRARGAHPLAEDEQGMVLLFWALSFIGILAFFVIVADAGLVFLERRSLQNVADASALAGARELYLAGAVAGEAEAIQFASESDGDLTGNSATASDVTMEVMSIVGDDAQSILAGGALGFGSPEVQATATARVGADVLPGPGVFCVGTWAGTVDDAEEAHLEQLTGLPANFVWQLPYGPAGDPATLLGGDYYTVLRFGAGDGSNAGYVRIDGAGANKIRDCFEHGSSSGLEPQEDSQTGIAAGPADQGLEARLRAADARDCMTWEGIQASLRAADPNEDGRLEYPWTCSPNLDQRTAVVLIPVMDLDFTTLSGLEPDVPVYFQASQYTLAYYWIDALLTFQDLSAPNWKFASPAGQAEIAGVFLGPFLTELQAQSTGSGGTVACVFGVSTSCFLELIK